MTSASVFPESDVNESAGNESDVHESDTNEPAEHASVVDAVDVLVSELSAEAINADVAPEASPEAVVSIAIPDRADAPVSEITERFFKAIVAKVPVERIEELHLFAPLRQGGVETGIAVIAARVIPPVVVEPPLELALDAGTADAEPAEVQAAEVQIIDAGTAEADTADAASVHAETADVGDVDAMSAGEPVAEATANDDATGDVAGRG